MRSKLGVVMVLACGLGGCATEAVESSEPVVTSHVWRNEFPLGMNASVDVLFVIEDSPAMAPLQAKLANSYRDLARAIVASNSFMPPDMHIGVITTNPSDAGQLRERRFIADAPVFGGPRTRNYDGTLPDNVAQLADVGTTGAAPQPLALIPDALSAARNPGFLRAHATLAVIVIAASDDASAEGAEDAAAAIKALKADPTRVLVTAALGCDPATQPRLRSFLDQFPNRSATVSLCDATLDGLVAPLRQAYKITLGAPCINEALKMPLECNAWLVDHATGKQVVFPHCTAALDEHCWTLEPYPYACAGSESDLIFSAYRFPYQVNAVLECVTAD